MKNYYVYMLANRTHTVLYTGVTSDLERRGWQHKTKAIGGFTARYNVNRLVYYEATEDVMSALEREKEIKLLTRAKKNTPVESMNPSWVDLSAALFPPDPPDPSRMTGARRLPRAAHSVTSASASPLITSNRRVTASSSGTTAAPRVRSTSSRRRTARWRSSR